MDILTQQIRIDIKTENESLKKAIDLIQWAINEREFREYVLNFRNQYKVRSFLQTKNTNEWHLERLVSGSELNTGTDYTWDSVIAFFSSNTEIIGYTNDLQKIIYLNDKFLNRDLPSICNTLTHEYCHLVGMEHSLINPGNDIWMQTAPYAIGSYIQYMVEKKLNLPAELPFFPKTSAFKRFKYKLKKFFKFKV